MPRLAAQQQAEAGGGSEQGAGTGQESPGDAGADGTAQGETVDADFTVVDDASGDDASGDEKQDDK